MKRATYQQLALWTWADASHGAHTGLETRLGFFKYIKYICVSLNGWVSHWNQDKQRQHIACTLHSLQTLCPLLCQANSCNEVLMQLYSSYREPDSFFQSAGNFQLTMETSFCHRFVRQKKLHHLAFSAPTTKISLCNKKSIRFFYAIRYRNKPFSYLCLWFILWSISLVGWHLMLHKKGKNYSFWPKEMPSEMLVANVWKQQ